MRAVIFDISRCSFHDGAGVRTVVYFKGCTLACGWCHNPEGISPEKEILFHRNRCVNCGRCADICPAGACVRTAPPAGVCANPQDAAGEYRVSRPHCDSGGSGVSVQIDKRLCRRCGKCADRCPNRALVLCGRDMAPGEVFAETVKDKHYFEQSGGGVTFSGGEPLAYPDFLNEAMLMLKAAGVNSAVETALFVPRRSVETAAENAGHFYADIKHSDSAVHKTLTGAGNDLIVENLERLAQIHNSITVRIPLIPGVNDDCGNITGTAEIINKAGGGITAVEPLPYNNLYGGKYESLGARMKYPELKPQSESRLHGIRQSFVKNSNPAYPLFDVIYIMRKGHINNEGNTG